VVYSCDSHVLQCGTVCCSVLQCVLQCVFQWNSVCCSAFQCVAGKDTHVCTPLMVNVCCNVRCSVFHCVAVAVKGTRGAPLL